MTKQTWSRLAARSARRDTTVRVPAQRAGGAPSTAVSVRFAEYRGARAEAVPISGFDAIANRGAGGA
jgi:hypothetical protein